MDDFPFEINKIINNLNISLKINLVSLTNKQLNINNNNTSKYIFIDKY